MSDQPRAALPVYVGAFRRASVPFQGHTDGTPTAGFDIALAMLYRIQQIRSSHRRMSPVVTGVRPIRIYIMHQSVSESHSFFLFP